MTPQADTRALFELEVETVEQLCMKLALAFSEIKGISYLHHGFVEDHGADVFPQAFPDSETPMNV